MKEVNGKQIIIRFFIITLIIGGIIGLLWILLGEGIANIAAFLSMIVLAILSIPYVFKEKRGWYPVVGGFLGLLVLGILLVIIDSLRS